MKIKIGLIAIPFVLIASLVFLTGGPVDESGKVTPLDAATMVAQTIAQKGRAASLGPAAGFEDFGPPNRERSFRADLEFFETTLSYGTNADPRTTFLMLNAYINTNQHAYGIAFFERLLERYRNTMDARVRAQYLAAYAILRATYADNVPLLSRIGWMFDTFDLLEEAQARSEGDDPLVRWAAGLIYAQVPFFFFKKDEAYAELNWLAEHPETEPVFGFYREVYRHLAKLHARDGNDELAQKFLKKSGFEDYEPKAMFMGWFTTSREEGTAMADAQTLKEVVPGRVFTLIGFGFSDIHFVVSSDGKETIAIDAGTRPDATQAAYELLKAHKPDLPPVTTLITTHAHWDHVGGYSFLKSLNPALKIYGRGNFQGTVERSHRDHSYKYFRSAGFQHEWMANYRPDSAIEDRTTIAIGGTPIELIPTTGGETEDALFIFMPKLGVMFVGDFLMPYLGEPWVEEGFIDETVSAMQEVIQRAPKHVLHGHQPLTVLYPAEVIRQFRGGYEWLVQTTRDHIRNGYSVKEIVRLNLIPPGLQNQPEALVAYMNPRDYIIARIGDKMLGYWQEDSTGMEPAGLDNLTAAEYGRLLEDYLELSARDVTDALERMIDGGDNELALQMAVAAEKRYPNDRSITLLKEEAADRLRSLVQFLDPFKFTVYTEMIGKTHRPIPGTRIVESAPTESGRGQ